MITYKIQSGDTLSGIAKKYNTTVDSIASANGIKDKNLIYAGDTLQIPVYSGEYVSGSNTLYGNSTDSISSETVNKEIIDWQKNRPADYKESYSGKIKELVSELTGMDFSYDPETDIAYKLFRDEARKNARLAMEDTLGRAASLTGGYTNTAAHALAQQAYAGELSKASELIPELYEAAYDRYTGERDSLSDAIELLSKLDDRELDKYSALMKQYLAEGELLYKNFKDLSEDEFDRFIDYATLMNKLSK